MSLLVTLNGVNYIIPTPGETGWGTNLDNFFVGIAAGCLQKTGGSFTLSADTDFGASFGLKSLYYLSRGANISATGVLRLNNNSDAISWRNAANSSDLALLVNGSNRLQFNGNVIPTGSSALVANSFVYGDASGLLASTTNPTNGQLLIGSTGTNPVVASLTGTANQITVTPSAGSITLSTPQNIAASSSPTFAALTLTAALTVANGGTGDQSFTAYSVICGGTTSTNPLQSVASVGGSGQVLTSNGAGTLPTWQNAAGTGTVNTGVANQIAYYASSTNAVSGNATLTLTSAGVLTSTPAVNVNVRIGNQTYTGAGGVIEFSRPDDGAYTQAIGVTATTNDDLVLASNSGGSQTRISANSSIAFYIAETLANMFASTRPTTTLALTINSNKQLVAINGTAALPSYVFSSNTTTGFFNDGGSPAVSIAGTEKQVWNGSALYPFTNGGYDLGTSGFRYGNVYGNNILAANTGISVGGNQILPIVQVVQTATTSTTTTSSTTYVSTNVTATITPKFNTSKIKITVTGGATLQTGVDTGQAQFTIVRGSTNLLSNNGGCQFGAPANVTWPSSTVSMVFYDSPATTAATTYTVKMAVAFATSTLTFPASSGTAVILLEEYAQ